MNHAVVLSLVCVALYACSSDSTPAPAAASPSGPAVRGRVTDANGQPLDGVRVEVGAQSATADAQGQYTLAGVTGAVVVRFVKKGYVDGLERLTVGAKNATQLDAVLLNEGATVTVDATAGGEAAGPRGSKVIIPANAFVDKAGALVTGNVDVSLTPIDPSKAAEVQAAPGDFTASQAGQPTMLESFGMISVTARRGDEKLQVAAGKELEFRVPAPETVASPEATMPLWSFDEAKGVWVDEGTAQYDAASRTYIAKAKHLSVWNCDKPYLATCVCGLVTEKSGAALAGARVVSSGTTYLGTSEATTDDNGKFCIAVRKDSGVSVAAYHKSGGGQTRALQSGSGDTAVPPTLGDARCVDAGTWVVEKDVFVAADGSKQSCDAAKSVLSGTCADQLGAQIGTCYAASGACTIKSGVDGTTISYANGSKTVSTGAGSSTLYGPTGAVCATTELTNLDVDGGTVSVAYHLPSGDVFSFSTEANGSYTIHCPNGQSATITPEQQQALEACSGGGESSASTCTVEGGGTPADGGLGNLGTACTADSECTGGGNVCCDLQGTKLCYPKSTCDLVNPPAK